MYILYMCISLYVFIYNAKVCYDSIAHYTTLCHNVVCSMI